MKRIIAIALLATTVAFGPSQKKNGWERAQLKGKVKTVVQSGIQIGENGKGNCCENAIEAKRNDD